MRFSHTILLSALAHGLFVAVALWGGFGVVALEPVTAPELPTPAAAHREIAMELLIIPSDPEPEPELAPAATQEPEQASAPEPEPEPAPKPRRVVKREAPKPKPKPEPEPEPTPEPEIKLTAVATTRDEDESKQVEVAPEPTSPAEATRPEATVTLASAAHGERHGGVGSGASRLSAPAPQGRGRGALGGGVDRAGLMRQYHQRLYQQVNKRKRYPRAARRMQQEGRVVIEIMVDQTGKLLSARVHSSSGHELLDEAALETIRSVESFGARPEGLGWASHRFLIPIVYALA